MASSVTEQMAAELNAAMAADTEVFAAALLHLVGQMRAGAIAEVTIAYDDVIAETHREDDALGEAGVAACARMRAAAANFWPYGDKVALNLRGGQGGMHVEERPYVPVRERPRPHLTMAASLVRTMQMHEDGTVTEVPSGTLPHGDTPGAS